MSFRVLALTLLVLFLSGYAWRNWFVSLCWAVLLVAVVQHPDYPRNVAGIQGLNPWNFLMLNIVLAWFFHRREEGLDWDLPPKVGLMLVSFLAVITIGMLRLLLIDSPEFSATYVISEKFINCIKWILPGLLFFDACRTRKRVTITLAVMLGFYFLLAVQVVKWMPLGYALAGGEDMAKRAAKIIQNEIGFNRVTLAMMLAGASWAILSAVPLFQKNSWRLAVLGAAGITTLGQALTAGRSGYLAWGMVGVLICTLRWRKLLPVFPVAALVMLIALPGVRDRLFYGFGGQKGGIVEEVSTYDQLSGRNIAWPMVIDKITEAPWLGFGREAMRTTGVAWELGAAFGESFPHPHQAYLEQVLDNGLIGFACVMPIFFYAFWRSTRIALVRSDMLVGVVGCAAFSVISALMIASLAGQTFYPREGAVGLWVAIGLLLRVSLQWTRAEDEGGPVFEDDMWDDDEDGGGWSPVPVGDVAGDGQRRGDREEADPIDVMRGSSR